MGKDARSPTALVDKYAATEKPDEKPLTLKQYRAAVLLASGEPVGEVVRPSRLQQGDAPALAAQTEVEGGVRRVPEAPVRRCPRRRAVKLGNVLGVLQDFQVDITEKPSDRLKAAGMLLNAAFRSHEIAVLKKALAEVDSLKTLVNEIMKGNILASS